MSSMKKIKHSLFTIFLTVLLFSLCGWRLCYADPDVALSDPNKTIILYNKKNNVFSIKLRTASVGYVWLLKEIDANLIVPVKRVVHNEVKQGKITIPGYEEWFFKATLTVFKVPYKTNVTLVYRQLGTVQNIQGNSFTIITLP